MPRLAYPFSVPVAILENFPDTKIITNFDLSHYIEINSTSANQNTFQNRSGFDIEHINYYCKKKISKISRRPTAKLSNLQSSWIIWWQLQTGNVETHIYYNHVEPWFKNNFEETVIIKIYLQL